MNGGQTGDLKQIIARSKSSCDSFRIRLHYIGTIVQIKKNSVLVFFNPGLKAFPSQDGAAVSTQD